MNREKTVVDSVYLTREKRVGDGVLASRGSSFSVSDEREVELLSELIDALACLGDYTPMCLNAFSRTERFAHVIGSLEPNARDALARMLVQSALGKLEATRWYTRTSLELILELCELGHTAIFANQRDGLEHALERAILGGRPLVSSRAHPPNGRAFLKTWTHAVRLWQVIAALHSPHASRLLTALLRATDTQKSASDTSNEPCWWRPRTLTW